MQESAREHDGLNLQVFRVPPNDKKIQKARPCDVVSLVSLEFLVCASVTCYCPWRP